MVQFPSDDIVDEVPLLGSWVLPRGSVTQWQLVASVRDEELMFGTKL